MAFFKFYINSGQEAMVDLEKDEAPVHIRRGIYLLPHLFTTSALFAAFYAIVAAMKLQFDVAAIAIFVAMIADALDGRIARLTNTMSTFGGEYDSLSDMVSFGVAPALVMYSWGLNFLGKPGWLMAFCYTAAVALRLARFNTQLEHPDKRYFYGLPCPSAAGVIAGMIWLQDIYHLPDFLLSIIAGLLTVGLAVLMVSNIRYRSFKDSDLKDKVSYLTVLMVLLFFVAIAVDPPKVLFAVFFIYMLSGPVMALKDRLKAWHQPKKKYFLF
jgi:CDP-diacylglycerol--serine O-phosphatidyltransferase